MRRKIGKQSIQLKHAPRITAAGTVVGHMENEGALTGHFDTVIPDDMWGQKTFEQCERLMFEQSVKLAMHKCGKRDGGVDVLLGGDLLNQIISAGFAARTLQLPFLGLYGACSTIVESLLIGSALVDGGFVDAAACAASSHFSTAERQYRMPLELGTQSTPTSQRTVTGAGCMLVCSQGDATNKNDWPESVDNVHVTGGTIGRVVDLGITDANNMGAAMAPAAADTLLAHLEDTGCSVDDYDAIITGDLGTFGSDMFAMLCEQHGIQVADKHMDCGKTIYLPSQDVVCGASGCGCAAVVLGAYILRRIEAGDIKKAFVMATGALMSPVSGMQGESIPGIAHGVVLERRN
ncbi:MAG: stage V sporulation protein AD [Clostridia bacterium]|nr:stage V sporulation protein AD [Clostridia bacterium]